jgi:hypothetical protein
MQAPRSHSATPELLQLLTPGPLASRLLLG